MSFIVATSMQGAELMPAIEKPMSSPSTYNEQQGALLIDDGSGNWAVCGANPALIGAVALTPGGPDTTSLAGVGSFNIRGRKEFPNNTMQATPVEDYTLFRAKTVGAAPANPVGSSYGVVRDTDGFWKVNFADVVNTRFKVTGYQNVSPENQPYVLGQFLAANVQQN
jgi:hypothetical protein